MNINIKKLERFNNGFEEVLTNKVGYKKKNLKPL